MTAQQMNVDNIANNLANANTVGFKARRTQFQDLLYQTVVQPGASAGRADRGAERAAIGPRYAADRRTKSSSRRASPQLTDNPLDVGHLGPRASFRCAKPSGDLAYTRAGTFHLDRDGNVVTSEGDPLEPQITIPARTRSRSRLPPTAP